MDSDSDEDGYDIEENYYTNLNINKNVSNPFIRDIINKLTIV